jgi:hypothetical protein
MEIGFVWVSHRFFRITFGGEIVANDNFYSHIFFRFDRLKMGRDIEARTSKLPFLEGTETDLAKKTVNTVGYRGA